MESLANQVMAIVHKVDAGPVGAARPLHGRRRGRAVRPRPPAAHARHHLPRRHQHAGVEGAAPASCPRCSRRSCPTSRPMVDMLAAVIFDLPDLVIGRLYSTVRAVLPDVRQNIRTMAQTMPVGSMLMAVDQRSEVAAPGGAADPDPQRVGMLRPHHPRAVGPGVRRHRPLARAVGAGRPQLDAGPPQGQADILTSCPPGPRVHGARREPVATAHAPRDHVIPRRELTPAGAAPRIPAAAAVISRLLQPLLSLQGWEAYALVGLLVFAEDSVMLGFVFPGETAAILGGVLASKGGVTLAGIVTVVVLCAIAGDSVGYWVGTSGATRCSGSARCANARRASTWPWTSCGGAVRRPSSWDASRPSCAR